MEFIAFKHGLKIMIIFLNLKNCYAITRSLDRCLNFNYYVAMSKKLHKIEKF